jgi:hypothetical protein
MNLRLRTFAKALAAGCVLVLAAEVILPRLDVGRFSGRVKASLEKALGRRVEIGKVRLDLFGGPGFSVESVVIHDDPAAGFEPFAYTSLEARVSLRSLWSHRLEFASLRLVNPSINLVRPAAGPWNFVGLLTRTAEAGPAGARLPEIQVRGGRINFKFGDTKSVFYLTDALLDAFPPDSPSGAWRLRFEGQPARTDRRALGFGVFTAQGRWQPDPRTGGRVDVSLELERSPLAELVRLVRGYDIGIHGRVSSHARLAGPVSDIQLTGWIRLFDIHRWDLLPPHTEGWRVAYKGRLDLLSQSLELDTEPPASQSLPVAVRFRAFDLLERPRWAAVFSFRDLPLEPVPDLAANLGVALPEGLRLAGRLSGALGYAKGLQGRLRATDVLVSSADGGPLRCRSADLALSSDRITLRAAASITADQEPVTVEADYAWNTGRLSALIFTPSLPVAALRRGALRPLASVQLFREIRDGILRGHLRYRWQPDAPAELTGSMQLEGAHVAVSGLAEPLLIERARLVLRDGAARMDRIRGRAGQLRFTGAYEYRPGGARPHRFQARIEEADTAELERLLLPGLLRSEPLLTRALRLGRTQVPDWLERRRAEGVIEIASLAVPGLRLGRVTGRLRWDGPQVEVVELSATLGEGSVAGRLSADLRQPVPQYRIAVRFEDLTWMGGAWYGRADIDTQGTGAVLLENLRIEAAFQARSVSLLPDTEFTSVSGTCTLTVPGGLPQLRLSDLHATSGTDIFQGDGITDEEGRLQLELTSGERQIHLSGTVSPFLLEKRPSI